MPEGVVIWLFETMNEFIPFEGVEEEWDGHRNERGLDESVWDGDNGDFGRRKFGRGFEDKDFGEDKNEYYDQRLQNPEGRIDGLLKSLDSK